MCMNHEIMEHGDGGAYVRPVERLTPARKAETAEG